MKKEHNLRLKYLKDQLAEGKISQQEFDDKKKRLLELIRKSEDSKPGLKKKNEDSIKRSNSAADQKPVIEKDEGNKKFVLVPEAPTAEEVLSPVNEIDRNQGKSKRSSNRKLLIGISLIMIVVITLVLWRMDLRSIDLIAETDTDIDTVGESQVDTTHLEDTIDEVEETDEAENTRYYIIVGSFQSISNAENLRQQLIRNRPSAQIIPSEESDWHRVSIMMVEGRSNMLIELANVKIDYPEAYPIKVPDQVNTMDHEIDDIPVVEEHPENSDGPPIPEQVVTTPEIPQTNENNLFSTELAKVQLLNTLDRAKKLNYIIDPSHVNRQARNAYFKLCKDTYLELLNSFMSLSNIDKNQACTNANALEVTLRNTIYSIDESTIKQFKQLCT